MVSLETLVGEPFQDLSYIILSFNLIANLSDTILPSEPDIRILILKCTVAECLCSLFFWSFYTLRQIFPSSFHYLLFLLLTSCPR